MKNRISVERAITWSFLVKISLIWVSIQICEFTTDQLPTGLIAQLVRALHWYRRGHEFESRSNLNFFFQVVLLSAA